MTSARVLALLLAWQGSACTVGMGSAYVGQWREREEVEFEACREDDSGRCAERKQVTTRQEPRRFWGFLVTYPGVGASFRSLDGEESSHLRLDTSLEYIQGKGRLAFGVRTTLLVDLEAAELTRTVSTPVMAMGHLGVSERLELYAGLGMSPFTRLTVEGTDDETRSLTTHAAARGLVGLRFVLVGSRDETRLLLSFEADELRARFEDAAYRSLGLTGSIGIFF